jgi:lysophospholipase L1-like esterase
MNTSIKAKRTLTAFTLGSILLFKGTFMQAQTTNTGTQDANATPAPATPVPPPPPVNLSDIKYPLDQAHLFDPFWKSETVCGESVALVKENDTDPVYGTLLFTPKKIIGVHSSDGIIDYVEGQDYTVDQAQRRLILTPGTRIPTVNRADLYKHKGDPHSIGHKIDGPDTYLLYYEAWFRTIQVEVDYERGEPWTGYTPQFAGSALPKTIAKLKSGAGLNICVTGDSIATGANASNRTPPFMPGFVPLTGLGLQKAYAGTVTMTNLAVGGTWANGGVNKLPETIATKADLVIIAFGMNDVDGHNPALYARNVKAIIDGVKAVSPDTEFIVVSSILANPEWNWSPADQFIPYRDALVPLVGPGVAMADMTQLWTDMMKNKRYLDLTGNGINHPNDFGQRLYAKVLLSLLVDKPN